MRWRTASYSCWSSFYSESVCWDELKTSNKRSRFISFRRWLARRHITAHCLRSCQPDDRSVAQSFLVYSKSVDVCCGSLDCVTLSLIHSFISVVSRTHTEHQLQHRHHASISPASFKSRIQWSLLTHHTLCYMSCYYNLQKIAFHFLTFLVSFHAFHSVLIKRPCEIDEKTAWLCYSSSTGRRVQQKVISK